MEQLFGFLDEALFGAWRLYNDETFPGYEYGDDLRCAEADYYLVLQCSGAFSSRIDLIPRLQARGCTVLKETHHSDELTIVAFYLFRRNPADMLNASSLFRVNLSACEYRRGRQHGDEIIYLEKGARRVYSKNSP